MDFVLTCVFLYLTTPSKTSFDQYLVRHQSNYIVGVSKIIKQSLKEFFHGKKYHNFGLFTTIQLGDQYHIGLGGIWIDHKYFWSTIPGLLVILTILGFIYEKYRQFKHTYLIRTSITLFIILLCLLIILSQITEDILSSYELGDQYLMILLSFPYFMQILSIKMYPAIQTRLNNSMSTILWMNICCLVSFHAIYQKSRGYFNWLGIDFEYKQLIIGILPIQLFFGQFSGIFGCLIGLIISYALNEGRI